MVWKSSVAQEINLCIASSVGVATRYGLDGPGIESRWRPVHSVNYLPPSSAKIKERVELYFYSLSGRS